MSPVTHFLTGWVLANTAAFVTPRSRPRDLVRGGSRHRWNRNCRRGPDPQLDSSSAVVLPLPSLAAQSSVCPFHCHPRLCSIEAEMENLGTVLPGISLAFIGGSVGVARAGWRSMADSVSRAIFFGSQSDVARPMVSECLAKFRDYNGALGNHVLSRVGAWVFASGNDFATGGSGFRGGATKTISTCARLVGEKRKARRARSYTKEFRVPSFVPSS